MIGLNRSSLSMLLLSYAYIIVALAVGFKLKMSFSRAFAIGFRSVHVWSLSWFCRESTRLCYIHQLPITSTYWFVEFGCHSSLRHVTYSSFHLSSREQTTSTVRHRMTTWHRHQRLKEISAKSQKLSVTCFFQENALQLNNVSVSRALKPRVKVAT